MTDDLDALELRLRKIAAYDVDIHPLVREFDPYDHAAVAADAITTLRAQLAEAKARADRAEMETARLHDAISAKGGTEHAPTQFAFDAACAAAEKHLARADRAEAALAEARAQALRGAARLVWSEQDEKDTQYWGESHSDVALRDKSRAILAMIKGGAA